MNKKNLQNRLKKYLKSRRQQKNAGFTILEVLMAMTVGSIVVYAVLSLVVNLLGTDQREAAKSQTQSEMSQAVNYIASELKQAVYIYEGASLTGLNLTFDQITPVLAFWKLEEVPYQKNPTEEQQLPSTDDCASLGDECYNIRTNRHTYTLVVYGLIPGSTAIWKGPARIARYQLRKYETLNDLTVTDGYQDPKNTGFADWTSAGGITVDGSNTDILVDVVDDPVSAVADETCPTVNGQAYSLSPANNTPNSFYACVRPPDTNSGNLQDAIVYLRGNAAARAGQPNSRNPVYLPAVQRQVQARSVFERTPPDLGD